MNTLGPILRLHQHRSWVNHNLLAACEQLSEDQLRQPFQIGQGSVWQSLLHLHAAEFVWLEALQGNEAPLLPGDLPGQLPGNQGAEGGFTSLQDLKEKWEILNGRWGRYLAAIGPEDLDKLIYKTSTSSGLGKRFGTKCGDVLLHVCTHAHYTTAQVINMLRQLGITPLPDVMLISLARQQAAH